MPVTRSIPFPVLLGGAPFVGAVPFLLLMQSFWPLILGAVVSGWVLALWRSVRPDLLGALCTGPALGAPLLGAYQMGGGSTTVGSVLGCAALAWGVGALHWAWRHRVGAVRQAEKVLDDLHGLAPDPVDALVWMITRDRLHGRAEASGADRARLAGVLQTAGGEVSCSVTKDDDGTVSERLETVVNGVPVRVDLRTVPTNG